MARRRPRRISHGLERFSSAVTRWTGGTSAFAIALAVILIWAATGPLFGYSNTWQLVINTGTTIVTFLMVFLIQNTQNRDSVAMQIKLDELLRAAKGAETAMADLEDLTEEELEAFQAHYRKLAEAARSKMRESEGLPFAKTRTAPSEGGSRPAGD